MNLSMMPKDLPGIYFSSKGIVLVEQHAGVIKSFYSAPYPVFENKQGGVPGDDIFDVFKYNDMELLAFMQKVIRESQIETKGFVVSLPPKDLIIRFFEMPNIPKAEIQTGINFEMKKYIPFKVEELAFDFQHRLRPRTNIIDVIVCGMKQEALDRYAQLFVQLKLDVAVFEPGLFSLFRFLAIKDKALVQRSGVFVEFDSKEANILIADQGFPYFTRDIKFASGSSLKSTEEPEAALFRLINEVRVSVDYYRRQFSKKDIDELVLVSHQSYAGWVDSFSRELGLKVRFIALDELFKGRGIREDMLSDAGKAFGAALRSQRSGLISLNLVQASDAQRKMSAITGASEEYLGKITQVFGDYKKSFWQGFAIGSIILILAYGLGMAKILPVQKELVASSVRQPPLLPGVDVSSIESINSSEVSLSEKERDFRNQLEANSLLNIRLKVLPSLLPKGVWIENFIFARNPEVLELVCFSYAKDDKAKSDNMNQFIVNLKANKEFNSSFSSIEMKSYRGVDKRGYFCLQFEVVCAGK